MSDPNDPPAYDDAPLVEPTMPHQHGGPMARLAQEQQFASQERAFEDAERARMVAKLGVEFADRGVVEAAGVDETAVRAVDPQFDATQLLAIARESFLLLAQAESLEHPEDIGDLLSEQMFAQIQAEETAEVASHTLPLHPGLEITSADIIALGVNAQGLETATVELSLSAEKLVQQGTQIYGDVAQSDKWSEEWDWARTPGVNTAAEDEGHIVALRDSWMVPHRGWRVTAIRRR